MTAPERWSRIEALYHAARDRSASERAAFLDAACGDDAALRREVESLLAQPASDDGFLGTPAIAVAAQMTTSPGASVLTGRRIGVYQIQNLLGAGGMGEVYRARDTKLGRDVAMKILPKAFTDDPDRLARFEREARMLATLNHPNIATIHGIEESDGVRALVLELIEGDTLAEKVSSGALPIAEALKVAGQIADALDAAHERGIIHRDLKPANIKIRPDGTVKVLDFGLAKAGGAGQAGGAGGNEAITIDGTREGAVLGTPAYMSPEQARGLPVDKRTDIWAFGCVLYEILTGRAAFARDTLTDTLAAILEREPDWNALPPSTPAEVHRLLRRCLDKDVRRRCRDIGDARVELDEAQSDRGRAAEPDSRREPRPALSTNRALAVGGMIVASVVAASVWTLSKRGTDPLPSVTRMSVTLAANQELDNTATAAPLALSADGRRLAYVASSTGRTLVYVRDLDAFDAKVIEGTEGARYPFFSPDGKWLAFFADGKLKRVSIAGGAPTTVCDAPSVGRGGTWGPDGTIVFDPGQSGLLRVSAEGGGPIAVTSRDSAMDRRRHSWPQFLPDGQGLLTTVTGAMASQALAVLSFKTGEWHVLVPGLQGLYVSPGYLVYHAAQDRDGQLDAVGFDVETLSVRGSTVSVLGDVFRAANGGAAFFAISQTGTLIFAPGGLARTLVQVDRQGRRTSLIGERRGFRFPRFSPDGKRVAVTVDPRPSQIWVYDLERDSRIPLTKEGHNITPLWAPDGQRVAFAGRGGVKWAAADGSSPPDVLIPWTQPDAQNASPTWWSPDGRTLIFNEQVPTTDYDIWIAPKNEKPRTLVSTSARELGAKVSPDSRWLAYFSNESGRNEVYVRPFPNVNDHKWTISTAGGWSPAWSPDGHELFYMSGSSMWTVPVETRGASFVAGKPQHLFDGPFDTTQVGNFDVSPDGTRFVMVEADPDAKPTKINVVTNWAQEVQRAVQAAR